MRPSSRFIALLGAIASLALVSGCGGDDEAAEPTATPGIEAETGSAPDDPEGRSDDPGGAADDGAGGPEDGADEGLPADPERRRELGIKTGSDNSLQTFGSEAAGEERTEAEKTMRAYFEAIAERDFARACRWFAAGLRAQHADVVNAFRRRADLPPLRTCAELGRPLRALTEDSVLVDDARKIPRAEVLRVGLQEESGQTIVILRFATGRLMFFPMAQEDGRWRVWAMGPSPVRQSASAPSDGTG